MSRIKKNAVIQVGKGVYEIDPLSADLFAEQEEETPVQPKVTAVQEDMNVSAVEETAVSDDVDISFADGNIPVSEETPEDYPEEETPKFTPVTNPLKVAIDNGLIELSDLDPEEEAELRNAKYKRDRLSKIKSSEDTDPSKLILGFNKGDSKFLLIGTLANLGIYAVWLVLYIICVVCRESMLDQAVSQMAMSGTQNYIVEISSPLFTVLRLMLYALPVIMIAWTVAIGVITKKKKELCDNVFIIAAYVADFIAGTVAVIDIFAIRVLFE